MELADLKGGSQSATSHGATQCRDVESGIVDCAMDFSTVSPVEKLGQKVSAADEDTGRQYPLASRAVFIMLGLYMSLFLVSLDRTIVSTAVPAITNEFHSLDDIGWYASAYMMTACAFQLFFGRVYTFYSPKLVFIVSIFIFEIGSLLCAVAPNSAVFILGRAIAGLGSAGIFSGTIIISVHIIPLRQRPIYQSFMGMIMLISTITGPVIGGAFTSNLTWRWCFYINLPAGAATVAILFWLLPLEVNRDEKEIGAQNLPLSEKLAKLDPIGTALFLPAIVCLILALQWGGTAYAWNDARIILLWVLFGLLTVGFVAVQILKGENATVPPRIVKYRSVTASTWFAFFISAALMTLVYWLPTWFQAIQGVDAIQSGVRLLPLLLSMVAAIIVAGGTVSKVGYYTPFLILCSILMALGAGFISTFRVDTPQPIWIGYQVIFGFGIGLGQQQAGLAAQTVLPSEDVPIGVSVKFFGQQLGGAIFVSVAQNIFSNHLVADLHSLGLTNLNPETIVNLGATELKDFVGLEHLNVVLVSYNNSIDQTFLLAAILAALSLLGALLTEWKSVKGQSEKESF